jgi:hypothetical protein
MELRHNDFGSRDAFALVDVGGNAAAVVAHGAGAVRIENDGHFLGEACKRLVDGVIDHFVDHVMQARAIVGVADIHARALTDGIEPLEHLDRFSVVIGRFRNLLADGFGHVGAFESLTKNMCESLILVHQKGDPYRTKGRELTYCQIALFQAFAGLQMQSPFGPKFARAAARFGLRRKSRSLALESAKTVIRPANAVCAWGADRANAGPLDGNPE